MYKTARIFLTLLLAALLLPACTRKQGPTPSDRGTSMGGGLNGSNSSGSNFPDLIPAGVEGDFGLDGGLEPRDELNGGSIEDGMYNGKRIVEGILMPVYFGFDSSSISANERSKLQEAADYLSENPEDDLLIEGHCDWYGTVEYNIALGERRAASAMDYLLTLGIDASRLNTLSKGSLEATGGLPKDESAKDRRADLNVLKAQ